MNPKDPKFTRDYVMTRLSYDPDTGVFRWLKPGNNHTKVGSVAGHIEKATGYLRITLDGKRIMGQRLAWLIHYGVWPSTFVDHRDEVKSNNRIDNLREATKSQNKTNVGARADNKLGIKGVYVSKNPNRRKKYVATIKVDGKIKTLGYYATPEEAKAARDASARVLHGQFFKS